jgi:hypothetical protein
MPSRRHFLAGVGAAGVAPLVGCSRGPSMAGEMSGPDLSVAHRLRDGTPFAAPTQNVTVDTLIVGGGVAGITAAWRLAHHGNDRFFLLESESEWGGNSRAGQNTDSEYPLGAHYLPLPTRESHHVREILAAIGILKGDPFAAKPFYDEIALAYAPQERLYEHGYWHDGLVPHALGDPITQAEIVRFKAAMEVLKRTQGGDGKPLFAIPLALSSQDPAWLALDSLTMRDWLLREGYRSHALHWWVNYGCRDDYGTDYAQTSAWAGLHYFASRNAEAANAEPEAVLTWPEGNAYITRAMLEQVAHKAGSRLQRGFAFAVEPDATGVFVSAFDVSRGLTTRYRCRKLIWAAPAIVLAACGQSLTPAFVAAVREISYAPWLTATLTLRERPTERTGAALAWDNVLYDSPSVGYIDSTHQRRRASPAKRPVLSYYWPLTHLAPKEARQQLLREPWAFWQNAVLTDLAKAHPEIRAITERIDFWRNGHAMAQPKPRAIWGAHRSALLAPHRNILLAHSDAASISIFEEASWYGWQAADAVLRL